MESKTLVLSALLLAMVSSADAAPQQPLVPEDWREIAMPRSKAKAFVSPDGVARLHAGHSVAHRSDLAADMNAMAYRDGETITYQRRGESWLAVSGYRGNEIFYRKSNLACGGTRWHIVELRYPREAKKRLDDVVTAAARRMTAYSNDCQ
jgi:hypothetical protein